MPFEKIPFAIQRWKVEHIQRLSDVIERLWLNSNRGKEELSNIRRKLRKMKAPSEKHK